MRKSMSLIALMLSIAVILAACGGKPAAEGQQEGAGQNDGEDIVTITHELDTTDVKRNPQNVVVFDFGMLDTMDKLGIPVLGVPQNNVPPYLAKYESDEYKNIGSLREPDFESIHAMKPELIIIQHRQSEFYEELAKIAPTVYMGVDNSDYMNSIKNNITLIGEIFNKQAEAAQGLAEIEADVEALQELAAADEKKALVTLVTGGKMSAYGPNSRFGLIHDVFGIDPVDENIEVSTHGMSVSFEYVADINPDYLFVVDRDAVIEGADVSAKEVVENVLVQQTNAYKTGHIIYLDPNYWYLSGGGLVSVGEMVREVTEGLQQ